MAKTVLLPAKVFLAPASPSTVVVGISIASLVAVRYDAEDMVTQFFNAREASVAIGCSVATVSRWASRLGITEKFGSSLVLSKDDVERIRSEWNKKPGNPQLSSRKHERN